jgi:tetratricopeptide (TPR) repeat protein
MTDKSSDGLESHRKASAILQKLAGANPANIDIRKDLAQSYDRIAATLLYMGRPAASVDAERKALAIFQKLVDDNPAVTESRYDLARSYDYIGWFLLMTGKPVEGVETSRQASAIMQKLVADHPATTLFQFDLANFQTNIGRGLDRQKRSAEALAALEAGLVIRQRLAEADPGNAMYSRVLVESYAVRGGARARAGQPAAAADLRRALGLCAKLPHLDIEMQIERSRVLALMAGLGADAKSGVTKDEARAFADQAVAALAGALKTGWALPSELREPDFDAVRGRADFQKLFAEVEAKAEKVRETAPMPREKN